MFLSTDKGAGYVSFETKKKNKKKYKNEVKIKLNKPFSLEDEILIFEKAEDKLILKSVNEQ
jgi:hypothetical protein